MFKYIPGILLFSLCLNAQNPANYTFPPTVNPNPGSANTYTRAITTINLKNGFNYGFVPSSSQGLVNLSLGNNPSFVSSAYLGSGSSPNPQNCGNPSIDPSKVVAESAGNFEVTPSGASSYNFPIVMSPGTSGIQPNLNLIYNSQGGLGILGVGWNLSGLSCIERINKIPMHDGKFSGALLLTGDIYGLDGNRLFSLSGTYGQNSSTYYTETQNFSQISSLGTSGNGPEKFVVVDKTGNTLKYGLDNNSSLKGVNDNTVLKWYLNELKDQSGNYMKYYYAQLDGEVVIDRIEYTGNASAGMSPYNKITFSYIPLAEHSKMHINGKTFGITQLMKTISCWNGTSLVRKYDLDYEWRNGSYLSMITEVGSDGNELNPVRFCWEDPNDVTGTKTNQDLNSNFTAQDYAGLKTLSVDFNGDGFSDFACWNQGAARLRVYRNDFLNNYGTNNTDIDFTKIYDNPSQIFNNEVIISSSVCDENYDGKQELFTIVAPVTFVYGGFYYASQYRILKTYLDNNNAIQVQDLGTVYNSQGGAFDVEASPPQIFFDRNDFTGDGNNDDLRIDNETITLSVGGGSTYQRAVGQGLQSFIRPFNFDGDGVTDYIHVENMYTNLAIEIYKFTGSSFYIAGTGNASIPFPNNFPVGKFLCKHISFGDINGDGLDDIVYVSQDNSELYVMRNIGNSFTTPEKVTSFTPLNTTNAFDITCVDINADGKKDIVINENDASANVTTYYAYISYGDLILKGGSYIGNWKIGEALCVNYSHPKTEYDEGWHYDYSKVNTSSGKGKVVTGTEINYADYNGDGIYDQVNFSNNSNFIVTNNVNGESRLAITNIASGMGNKIQIRYANIGSRFNVSNGIKDEILKPITNPGYTNGTGNLLTNMYCVSHVTKTSGFSGQFKNTERYLYKNPMHHKFGRGFLGFEEVTRIDLSTLIGTTTTSTIIPAYINFVECKKQTSKYLSVAVNGLSNSNTYQPDLNKILSASEQTVNFVAQNGSGYFTQLKNTISTDFLNSTRSSTDYNYDMASNGNIKDKTTKTGWNLASPILLAVTNYTYTNTNGVYKPSRQLIANTQIGEPVYEREIIYNYDGQGRLTSTVNDQNITGLSGKILTTSYSNFNLFGLATQVTLSAPDITSRSSQTIYDSKGRFIIKKINEIGNFSEYVYDQLLGKTLQSKEISGLITNYEYDGLGRLIKTINPNATQSKSTYAWESPNNYPYESQPTGVYSIKTQTDGQPYVKDYYSNNSLKLRTETQDYTGSVVISDKKYNVSNGGGLPDGTLLEENESHYPSQAKYLKTVYNYETVYFRPSGTITYSQNGGSSVNTGVFTQINYSQPSDANNYYNYSPEINYSNLKSEKKSLNAAGQQTLLTSTHLSPLPSTSQKAEYTYNSAGKLKSIKLTSPSNPSPNVNYSYTYNGLGQKIQSIDPTRGTSTYQYSTLGELMQSTEAGVTFMYAYDVLGRVTSKTGSSIGNSTYEYFTGGNVKQLLKKITSPNTVSEYLYDNMNNLVENKETITSENKVIKSNYQFDTYGREIRHTYPNGLITKKVYNFYGHLSKITDVQDNVLWQLQSKDALGRITEYSYGNGISTKNKYDNMNNLGEIDHGNGNIFKQTYTYHTVTGNLISRRFDNYITGISLKDAFTHDNMDRLTSWTLQDVNTSAYYNGLNTTIDILGNITYKADAGNYVYSNPSKPFTLTQINNATSNVSPNTLNVQYNDLEKVSQISESVSNKQMDFIYGSTDQRIKMLYTVGGVYQYSRYYGDNYEKQQNLSSYKEWDYVMAPSGLCAVYINNNGVTELNYVLNDHLASPVLLTDNNGALVEEYSFDAWGRRRNPVNWTYTGVTLPTKMIRGYTLHEQLDEFNMINMNARIYDPVTGRFIQPDNRITDENNLQTYNIYAYCNNSPLRYKDPTGHYGESASGFDSESYFSYLIAPSIPYYLQTNYVQGVLNSINSNVEYLAKSSYQQSTELYNNAIKAANEASQYASDMTAKYWNESKNYMDKVATAAGMTVDWALGRGRDNRYFLNNNISYAMSDAYRVNQAREFYYNKYADSESLVNSYVIGFKGTFGASGAWHAGFDPIEQFIGTYRINIYNLDGGTLWFVLTNQTSMNSFLYDLGPSWERSTWGPGGNMNQSYIWSEPIKR